MHLRNHIAKAGYREFDWKPLKVGTDRLPNNNRGSANKNTVHTSHNKCRNFLNYKFEAKTIFQVLTEMLNKADIETRLPTYS